MIYPGRFSSDTCSHKNYSHVGHNKGGASGQRLLGRKGIDHTYSHKNYSHVGHNKGGASGWRPSGKKGVGLPGPVELNGGVGGSH